MKESKFIEFYDAGDVEENKPKKAVAWKSAVDARLEEVTVLMREVNEEVLFERIRQNKKWGLQRHGAGAWLAILVEELGEAAQAMMKDTVAAKATDADDLYSELIQISAVASAWAEQVREENE